MLVAFKNWISFGFYNDIL